MHFTVTCLSLVHSVDFWLIASNSVYRWNFIELPVCKKWTKINILMFLWRCGVSSSSMKCLGTEVKILLWEGWGALHLVQQDCALLSSISRCIFCSWELCCLDNQSKNGNKECDRGSTVLSCHCLKSPYVSGQAVWENLFVKIAISLLGNLKWFIELFLESASLIGSFPTMNGPHSVVKLCKQSVSANYVS